MADSILANSGSPFDSIRHIDDSGHEHWFARELMSLLGYLDWRRFEDTIQRAMIACENVGSIVLDHFVLTENVIERRQGGGTKQIDYRLSRYGSYLVAMNGDPRKPEIAMAQSYFAIKTREAETQQESGLLQVNTQVNVLPDPGFALRSEAVERVRQYRLEAEKVRDSLLPDFPDLAISMIEVLCQQFRLEFNCDLSFSLPTPARAVNVAQPHNVEKLQSGEKPVYNLSRQELWKLVHEVVSDADRVLIQDLAQTVILDRFTGVHRFEAYFKVKSVLNGMGFELHKASYGRNKYGEKERQSWFVRVR